MDCHASLAMTATALRASRRRHRKADRQTRATVSPSGSHGRQATLTCSKVFQFGIGATCSRRRGAGRISHSNHRQPERVMMKAITPEWLFSCVGVAEHGFVEWGAPVPERGPGVYVITAADAVEGQQVVYIGRTKHLACRLSQFYRHRYGASAPHSGGQQILKLSSPRTVHWAAVTDYAMAEHRMLEVFRSAVGNWPYGNRMKSARMAPISN